MIFSVISPSSHSIDELERAIIQELKRTFGEKYLALSGLELINYNEKRAIGVIRCYHKYLEYIRATLALINNIRGVPVVLYTLKVTGTKKKALRIIHSHIPR